MAESQPTQADQWWSAFPSPRAKAPNISADEVMQMFDDMDIKPEPRSFLLVDVRRNDWEVSSLCQRRSYFLFTKHHVYI
jgi:arsenical-resistance protein 2